MNIQETIKYIESFGKFGIKLGLHNIEKLLSLLGDPQKKLKIIHVAGTNGKGSTSTMLCAILAAAGYKTGLYTSPALVSFNERIQINNHPISDNDLIAYTARIKTAVDQMIAETGDQPTGFEMETALAFLYYYEHHTDICVVEVGMGGRLDATNIIPPPEVVVITKIGLDHTGYLGSTLAEIAAEKAEIIKPGCTVVIASQEKEAEAVLIKKAKSCDCPTVSADLKDLELVEASVEGQTFLIQNSEFRIQNCAENDNGNSNAFAALKAIKLSLLGAYQQENLATVLKVIKVLKEKGMKIPNEAVKDALATVKFPGRFEILSRDPMVLIDGAHNPDGIAAFVKTMNRYFKDKRIHLYFGMLADKDVDASLKTLLPIAEEIHILEPFNDRAMSPIEMQKIIKTNHQRDSMVFDTIPEAFAHIKTQTDQNIVHVFVGSLYLIGHVRKVFENDN